MASTSQALFRVPTSAESYSAALEGLTRIDQRLLAAGNFPPLYRSGVRYKREPRDVWRHVDDIYKSKWGDCEDLAAWRVAELRQSGEDPSASVLVYQSGPKRYHAIVRRGDGTREDPSKILGMKPGGASPMGNLEGIDDMNIDKRARQEIALQVARCARRGRRKQVNRGGAFVGLGEDPIPGDRSISFDLYRSGKGWSGVVRLPIAGQPGKAMFLQTTKGPSKTAAASKAVNFAAKAMKSPVLRAVVPPQAALAARILSSSTGRRLAKSAIKKLF